MRTFAIMGRTSNAHELRGADVVVRPALSGMSSAGSAAASVPSSRPPGHAQQLPALRASHAALKARPARKRNPPVEPQWIPEPEGVERTRGDNELGPRAVQMDNASWQVQRRSAVAATALKVGFSQIGRLLDGLLDRI